MNERPIDGVRIDVEELQAQTAVIRGELAMLWRHAVVLTLAVLLIGALLWLNQ